MHRGTAISAPFALAHFLFLPAMDPIEIAHYPVRFLFFTLTYSMIFHRGVPNFSYAQEGSDNNDSTIWVVNSSDITFDVAEDYDVSTLLWIVNSSAVTMGVVEDKSMSTSWISDRSSVTVEVVEDNDVSTTRIGDNSNMSTDSTSDNNVTQSSSPDYVEATTSTEDYNISALWIENSSASTTDLVDDNDFSTSTVVDSSTASVTSNSVSPTSNLVNVEIVEDYFSMSWVDDNLTVTTGIAEEHINTSWITGTSTVTKDLNSGYSITVGSSTVVVEVVDDNNTSMASIADSSTVSINNVGENIVTKSWITNPSTVTIDFTSDDYVSPTSHPVNVEVEESKVSMTWIADSSTATMENVEENNVSTSWTADISNVAKGVTFDNIVSTTVDVENVEDNSVSSTWIADSSTATMENVEENNVSASWIADTSNLANDVTFDNIVITTVDVENVEDSSVSSTWIAGSSIVTIGATTDNDVSPSLSTVNLEFAEVPENVSAVWIEDGSTVTMDLVEDDNVSTKWVMDSTTMTADVNEDHNATSLWVVNGFDENAEEEKDWSGTCRDGKMQSPIHITTVTTAVNPEAQPIIFVNYDLASLEASLTSHTIKFDPKPHAPGYQIGIAGGGLMGFYELNHIHLHWSNSEHAIDHNTYKMEAHLVHFKAPYGNWSAEEILDQPDGIAVLAVLYEFGTADPIIEDLILNLGRNLSQAEMPKVMPKSFLPDNTDEFIRYRGSLTTPPCSEVVIWTVFPSSKTLTEYQVKWLSTRKLSAGVPDPANYRPLQSRNDREVYMMKASYSINLIPGHLASTERGHAAYTAPSIALMLATILLFSFRLC